MLLQKKILKVKNLNIQTPLLTTTTNCALSGKVLLCFFKEPNDTNVDINSFVHLYFLHINGVHEAKQTS